MSATGHQIHVQLVMNLPVLYNVYTSIGKKQRSKLEVNTSCQLSRVQIHIERVIGFLV